MKKWLDTVRLSCVFAGVSLIFYGTRYLDGQPSSTGFLVGGFSLITAAIALAIYLMRAAELSAERQSRRLTVWWGLSLLIGYGLLILYRKLLGSAAEPETNMQRVLLGLWVSILLVSIFWGIGLEWAFRLSGRGRFAEPRRVERAGRTWILVGLLLGSIVALNYVAVRKNRSWDWSYLKTAKASGATVKILGSLEKDLKVGLFFPATNEVTSHIRTYFDALPASESKVKIQYFDADLNPTAAEEFKASRNGQVILKFGDATERIEFGATLTAARKNLRNLDAEFQKALLAATQKRKVLYFTRGHGELAWTGSDGDPMKSIKLLEGFLRGQNYTMKYFGVGEGSAKSVPDDADAVVVIGGTTSMLPEEVSAIGAYVDKGGSLLAMLDMDAPSDGVLAKTSRDISNDLFVKFLADKGVRYTPTPLANAENFVAATRSDADSWFLFTNVFTSHESISSMARNDQRTVLLTFRSEV
ncbi:MAG: Gldg family protein [Proteobacteria bacterium]|nr:Gldg family protein [Pseudomonadota bacterium]